MSSLCLHFPLLIPGLKGHLGCFGVELYVATFTKEHQFARYVILRACIERECIIGNLNGNIEVAILVVLGIEIN